MKCYLIIALIAFTGLAAQAQTRFRTDESVRSQLMNGTAPGLLFSKSVRASKEQVTGPVNMGSLGRQIRGNAMQGVLYKETTAPAQPVTESGVQTRPDTSSAGNTTSVPQKSSDKAPFHTTAH